jgi:hypothetical protein
MGGEDMFTANEQLEFVKTLIRKIGEGVDHRTNPEQLRELHAELRADKHIHSVEELLHRILRWLRPIKKMWNYADKSGWIRDRKPIPKPAEKPAKDRPEKRGDKPRREKPTLTPAESKPDMRGTCRGCGRLGHKRDACRGKDHPDYNKADCEFADSEAMKAMTASCLKDQDGNTLTTLPWNRRTDGSDYKGMSWDSKPPSKKQKTKGKPLCKACHVHDLLTLSRYGAEDSQHTTPAMLHCHDSCMPVNILFDTGALQGNYLSEDVAG